MNTSQSTELSRRWWQSKMGMILLAFLAIAAFFLITEHTAHFFGVLPFVLLLLCPLLHLFMHRGHSDQNDQAGHSDHGGPSDPKQQPLPGGKL